jgi:hypothetical protein
LALPGDLANTETVLAFLAREISTDTYLNLIDQYHPCYKAFREPPLDRSLKREEYGQALRRLDQRRRCRGESILDSGAKIPKSMTIQTTYTQARTQFAHLCDAVTNDREIVIIHRRGAEDMALIAADELAGLLQPRHPSPTPV